MARKGKTSVLDYNPQIAAEWHPTKNGDLSPANVSYGSSQRVWWLCPKGHEWEVGVSNRILHASGCPVCSLEKKLLQSNLALNKPEIAAEWHPAKNGDLRPSDVGVHSNMKIWWQCELGHEWEATPEGRAKGTKCPYCTNRKVLKGFNDLETKSPALAKQWHPTKNGNLTPDMIVYGTDRRVWWQCEKGHEWESPVCKRYRGVGCPVCCGKKVSEGHNDLATLAPHLALEWHPVKNGELTPQNITCNSLKDVWWKCEKGHEWKTSANNRYNGSNCPACAAQKLLVNVDDLFAFRPMFKNEWHSTKNGDIQPNDMLQALDKPVWWQCARGHEYQLSLSHKLLNFGCPLCDNRYVKVGETDLATLHPRLATEWHPTKNEQLMPSVVSTKSAKLIWWRCELGHEWQERIFMRVRGTNCPYCSGHRVMQGFNDLATKNPKLAAQWHPTKNGDLKPTDVSSGSSKKVWWLYPYDDPHTGKHFDFEWEAPVYARNRKPGCPFLTGKRVWPGYND